MCYFGRLEVYLDSYIEMFGLYLARGKCISADHGRNRFINIIVARMIFFGIFNVFDTFEFMIKGFTHEREEE